MIWDPIKYLKHLELDQLYRLRNECNMPEGLCQLTVDGEEHLISLSLIRSEMRHRFYGLQQAALVSDDSWDPVVYLKERHTRELLSLRNDCHKFHGEVGIDDKNSQCRVTLQQVLDELNTREHIPSKQEAKLLRQLMGQNKMTEAQVRAVPKFATMLAQAQHRRIVSPEVLALYKKSAPHCWVTKKMLVLPA